MSALFGSPRRTAPLPLPPLLAPPPAPPPVQIPTDTTQAEEAARKRVRRRPGFATAAFLTGSLVPQDQRGKRTLLG